MTPYPHLMLPGSMPSDGLINDGRTATIKYLTGYVVEKSLSVVNVFVIAMIFGFFAVPAIYQHRVLFWGILGALVLRGLFIGAGVLALEHWHWILYLFGALLVVTGARVSLRRDEVPDVSRNLVVRLARRLFPVTDGYRDHRFVVKERGRWLVTPLLVVLLTIEATDVLFAVDSIPAVFAITRDPFLV